MYTRLLVTVATVALAAAFATQAHAADLRAPPVVYLPPPPTWQGWYVGGNVGVGWFDPDVSVNFAPFGVPLNAGFNTSTEAEVVGGVHGGYNWQFAPQWVAGVEGDIDFTSMRASATAASFNTSITASADVNWLASVRGRVGYLWTPGLLLYGTAGAAWADIDYQANLQSPGFIAGVQPHHHQGRFRGWRRGRVHVVAPVVGARRVFVLRLQWINAVVRVSASNVALGQPRHFGSSPRREL